MFKFSIVHFDSSDCKNNHHNILLPKKIASLCK